MRLKKGKHNILVIPDLQCPFEHPDAFDFLAALADTMPDDYEVVNIGDSMDAHALSRWATDPDGYSPKHEYERALESLHVMYSLFPEGKEVVSNHNTRIAKRAFDAGIPSRFLKNYEELMDYPPGWSIHDFLQIDGVLYEHGHTQGGRYAAINIASHNGDPTVIGHHHSTAGVLFLANRLKLIWGMNVGCLIDRKAYAFAYAKETKYQPTLGAGKVLQGVPFFIPMLLDARGRWIGEIICG